VRAIDVEHVERGRAAREPHRLRDQLLGKQRGWDLVEDPDDVQQWRRGGPELSGRPQVGELAALLRADVGEDGNEAVERFAEWTEQRPHADGEPAQAAIARAVPSDPVLPLAAGQGRRDRVGLRRGRGAVLVEAAGADDRWPARLCPVAAQSDAGVGVERDDRPLGVEEQQPAVERVGDGVQELLNGAVNLAWVLPATAQAGRHEVRDRGAQPRAGECRCEACGVGQPLGQRVQRIRRLGVRRRSSRLTA
jgi:hypothetical protein